MGISIPKGIFGFKRQSVNEIKLNKNTQEINVICRRDRRMKVIYLSDLKILDSLYQKSLLSSGYTKIKFNVLKLNGYRSCYRKERYSESLCES